MIPITQKYLYVGIETKVFDVSSDALPLNGTFMEMFLNISEVSKVHPVNKEMERCRIRDREEEDRMIW